MKKYAVLIVAISLLVMLCACTDTGTQGTTDTADAEVTQAVTDVQASAHAEALKQIVWIDTDLYEAKDELGFDGKVLPYEAETSIDETVSQVKDITLFGKDLHLIYRHTRYSAVSSYKFHEYIVNDNEKQIIWCDEEGRVRALLYDFATIDISPSATPSEVRALLEPLLQELVDVDKYEFVKEPDASLSSDGSFGNYFFYYYHLYDDYVVDFMRVAVNDEGQVFGLRDLPLMAEVQPFTVDKELASTLIELKLKEFCQTMGWEYVSFTMSHKDPPYLEFYNNEEMCIRYHVSTDFRENGILRGELKDILIPLRLLTTDASVETQAVTEAVPETQAPIETQAVTQGKPETQLPVEMTGETMT